MDNATQTENTVEDILDGHCEFLKASETYSVFNYFDSTIILTRQDCFVADEHLEYVVVTYILGFMQCNTCGYLLTKAKSIVIGKKRYYISLKMLSQKRRRRRRKRGFPATSQF
jgi:hypothetical protein